jgi:hypothetical protein
MNQAAGSTAFDFSYTVQHIAIGLLFAILLASVWPALLHAEASETAIVFYAEPQIHEELWPALFQALDENLAAGIGETPVGVALDRNPVLLRSRDIYPGIEYPIMIQVRLLGRCDVVPQADHPLAKGPLGWVEMVSGGIQPLIFIDCTRLAKVLGPATLGLDKQGRQQAISQAIAHVLIHEWIHIATQNPAHGTRGVTKEHLSVRELTTPPADGRLPSASARTAPVSSTPGTGE